MKYVNLTRLVVVIFAGFTVWVYNVWGQPAGGFSLDAIWNSLRAKTYITATTDTDLTNDILLSAVHQRGSLAGRPAANTLPPGSTYCITDTGQQRCQRNNGTSWDDVSALSFPSLLNIPNYAGSSAQGGPATTTLGFNSARAQCNPGDFSTGNQINGDANCNTPSNIPGGTAGGGLSGNYPNPVLDNVNGFTLSTIWPDNFNMKVILDGSDGNATISVNSNTSKRLLRYNNLHINPSVTLSAGVSGTTIIGVKGTLNLEGNISAGGLTAGGKNGGTGNNGTGGLGRSSIIIIASAIIGNGTIVADGGSGASGVVPTTSAIGAAGQQSIFMGQTNFPGIGGSFAVAGTSASSSGVDIDWLTAGIGRLGFLDGAASGGGGAGSPASTPQTIIGGGSGGSGVAGDSGSGGIGGPSPTTGAGGAGGGGAGAIIIYCKTAIPAISVFARGGPGGNATGAGGGGGGGGGGGFVLILAPSSSATMSAAGGSGGNSTGTGNVPGSPGINGVTRFVTMS